jgi:hypothetical protein
MSERIYSDETGDFIGTATYCDNGRKQYSATSDVGRTHACTCRGAAIAWLTTQYNRTH